MRIIKRALLFGSEIGMLLFDLVFPIALATLVFQFTSPESLLPLIAFLFGLLLSVMGHRLFRRKTQAWKIEYDAVGWRLSRAERELHPRRARYKRIARRVLVCVPSAIAAVVLFFFPVVSHIFQPQSQYLTHYRIPIPWTVTVFEGSEQSVGISAVEAFVSSSGRGRFGVTPFWGREAVSSMMHFQSSNPKGPFGSTDQPTAAISSGAAHLLRREFSLGNAALTCWQYLLPNRRGGPDWHVSCKTPEDVHEYNFFGWFYGDEGDLPLFYKIIEGVTPVK
jgi:hypothetical protein